MKRLLLAIILGALALAYASDGKAKVMTFASPNEAIEIRLPANPTTGFQWSVRSYNKTYLELLSNTYIASGKKQVGAGGTAVYRFALKPAHTYPQTLKVCFRYAREWEPNVGETRCFDLKVPK